jgi:MFS superfamily sulfate permease-like transporter
MPSFRTTWKGDLLASIVVFLVALPLCMGVAIASGLPPATGMITGIVGGLIVGFLAGSPLQVSGPAAGLIVIVLELVQKYRHEYAETARLNQAEAGISHEALATSPEALLHAVGVLGVVVLLAGALQVAAGLLKLGQWFRAVSPAVINGMLAGIGVLIFASQFHVMVDDQPKGSGLDNLLSIPGALWKGIVPLDDESSHHKAAMLGFLTIVAIVLWPLLAPKKLRVIPAPLGAVILATTAAALLGFTHPHSDRGVLQVNLPSNLLEAVQLPTLQMLSRIMDSTIVLAAVSLALVASAETLLCATAVDRMHQGPRTRYDRELAAQGVGNLLCGLLGALPMTGVIVRSSANVEAGGKTRASAIMHGAWLLLFVSLLPFVLELIPTASLAAVLVYTGYKLVNPKAVRALWDYGKSEVAIYAATVGAIVVTNLLTGILVGIGLALAKLLYTFSHLAIRIEKDTERNRTVLYLEGAATFIRLPKLAAALESVPPSTELHVHFEQLRHIDHACLDLLINWEKQHEASGGSLVIDWETLTARFHGETNEGTGATGGTTKAANSTPA